MNTSDLQAIFTRGEDSRHQFKRDVTNGDSLAAELAAFANSGGGRLFLGVADDGSVAGLDAAVEWVADPVTDQVTDQVSPEASRLLAALIGEMTRAELQDSLSLKHLPHFRGAYLRPALDAGLIELTIPDKPNSRLQKYRLTAVGQAWLQQQNHKG